MAYIFCVSWLAPSCFKLISKTLRDYSTDSLDERWHSCACGCELDRDTASAKVILDLGRKALSVGTRPTSATA